MKNLRICAVLALTLLIALGAVFGVATAPFVHAATTHTTPAVKIVTAVAIAPPAHTASAAITPNINGVNCGGRTDFFTIYSLSLATPASGGGGASITTCFANGGGPISLSIPFAYAICTGNNAGQVLLQNPYEWLVEPQHNTCYGFNYATILAVQIY